MKCLVLVRRTNVAHPALRQMLPKESGKAKPLAWGPMDGYSHDLFEADIAEDILPVAAALADQTGVLLMLPMDANGVQQDDQETIVRTLARVVALKPL